MVQADKLGNRNDWARVGRLHVAGLRTILVERQMRACPMRIGAIGLQVALETAFVEHDQVIQALAANAADQGLDIRSRQGERGADNTCSILIVFTCSTNSWPKMRSRSRSKYCGALSHGKASRSW